MPLMTESGMERRAETASPHRSPKPGRVAKRAISPASKGRRHRVVKSVKLPEPPRRKDGAKEEEEGEEVQAEEVMEVPIKSTSTVVNVDTVREKAEGENEELLGLLENEWQEEGLKPRHLGVCELALTVLALAVIILFFPLSIWFCVKIVREHERAVIFRLGHLLQKKPRGPGLLFYLPFLDVCQKVDIRLKMLKVPSHTVVTKDLVRTEVSAVCYYRVENVSVCYMSLAGVPAVLQALVQVSDREVMAHHTFTQVLLDRKKIAQEIQVALDSVTCKWGIKVERAEIEDLCLPPELQHNYAVEAEAKRQAQIRVIAAEGEKAACEALKASMDVLSGCPMAAQLRLLQLLNSLRTEHPAVVLILPSDLLHPPSDLLPLTTAASHNLTTGDTSTESVKDSPMM